MASRIITFASVVATLIFCSSTLFAGDGGSVMCELNVRERYEYYDIIGNNIDELQKQMNKNGTRWHDGIVYTGLTSWKIDYVYDITSKNGRYAVKSASTKVDIVYRMPRMRLAVPDLELTALWNGYQERLQHHEFGHKDLAVKAASEVNEILATMPSYGSADELAQEVTRRAEEKFKRLKQIQVAYDHETRHGETQGAVLPSGNAQRLAATR